MGTWTNETLLSQHISGYDVTIEYLGQNARVLRRARVRVRTRVSALNDPYVKNPRSDLRLGLGLGPRPTIRMWAWPNMQIKGHVTAVDQSGIK